MIYSRRQLCIPRAVLYNDMVPVRAMIANNSVYTILKWSTREVLALDSHIHFLVHIYTWVCGILGIYVYIYLYIYVYIYIWVCERAWYCAYQPQISFLFVNDVNMGPCLTSTHTISTQTLPSLFHPHTLVVFNQQKNSNQQSCQQHVQYPDQCGCLFPVQYWCGAPWCRSATQVHKFTNTTCMSQCFSYNGQSTFNCDRSTHPIRSRYMLMVWISDGIR